MHKAHVVTATVFKLRGGGLGGQDFDCDRFGSVDLCCKTESTTKRMQFDEKWNWVYFYHCGRLWLITEDDFRVWRRPTAARRWSLSEWQLAVLLCRSPRDIWKKCPSHLLLCFLILDSIYNTRPLTMKYRAVIAIAKLWIILIITYKIIHVNFSFLPNIYATSSFCFLFSWYKTLVTV